MVQGVNVHSLREGTSGLLGANNSVMLHPRVTQAESHLRELIIRMSRDRQVSIRGVCPIVPNPCLDPRHRACSVPMVAV
jgi:hypothetical protein